MEPMSQTEPLEEGANRVLAALRARIDRDDVNLYRVVGVAPPGRTPSVIHHDPTAHSRSAAGTPLLMEALCADRLAWPAIHLAFESEGFYAADPWDFDPGRPETGHGRVCYASRTRGVLLVPVNPGAERAVERTGRALLTPVVH